jgi:hypothetical protein
VIRLLFLLRAGIAIAHVTGASHGQIREITSGYSTTTQQFDP